MEEALASAVDKEFEVEAQRITPRQWAVYWPDVEKQLDTIPQYWMPYWTKDFINASVMLERWQAWGFGDIGSVNLIALTHIIEYPGARVLQMMLAFGNELDAVAPLMEATFERFASETRCDYCEIVGRPGWEKKFNRFKRVGVVLRCEVQRIGVQ